MITERKRKQELANRFVLAIREQKPLEELEQLRTEGASIDSADGQGRTGLHVSAARGDLERGEYLLSNGANTGKRDEWGWVPLHDAAWADRAAYLKLLKKYKADMHPPQTNDGESPMQLALKNHNYAAAQELDESEPKRTVEELVEAGVEEQIAIAKEALEKRNLTRVKAALETAELMGKKQQIGGVHVPCLRAGQEA